MKNILSKNTNRNFIRNIVVTFALLVIPFASTNAYSSYTPTSSYSPSTSYSSYTPSYSSSGSGSSYSSYTPSYSDYGYSSYTPSYSDYGYSSYTPSYSDYGYSSYTPNYSSGYDCYDCYGGYDDYSYGGGYDDYGCYSSDCYGGYDDYGYDDYSYGSGGYGGGSAGGALGALGLNLNYSNTETNITDNSVTDNSVRIKNDNSTTTTTNTCSNGNNATSSGNCNTTTVNNVIARDDVDIDLDVICIVSDRTIEEGDTVTFEARISGGRPSYRIEWDGDISGDDEKERVRFNRRGTYEVTVEVRDANGDRASDDCEVVVRDEDDDDDDDRRITVSTDTNLGTPTGNLSSLDSVFLSQVPYTGPGDVAKVLGVLALIAVWSTGVALYLKKQRTVKVISNKIANFKEQNKNANKIA